MKNIGFSCLLFCCVIQVTLAEQIDLKFIPTPKEKANFSGSIPFISNQGFEHINEKIQIDLLQDETRIDLSSEVMHLNSNYLSLHIHQEIEGGRSYYREKYYVIELHKKRLLTLNQVLKKYNVSQHNIETKIAQKLSDCLDETLNSTVLEYCADPTLEYLLRYFANDETFIHLSHADGFYLKDHIIGINYDAGPYSVSFEYDTKKRLIK